MTASQTEIVYLLKEIDLLDRYNYNWQTHPEPSFWDVDDDTYINGILLMVDMDFEHGSLLEIVERSSGVVSYLVVVEFVNSNTFLNTDRGSFHLRDWDAEWYPDPAGTFFERKVSKEQVCRWAVDKIYGLMNSWYDRKERPLGGFDGS